MSRIGKQPIPLSAGVTATIDGRSVMITGPKGTLTRTVHPYVTVTQQDGSVRVSVMNEDEKLHRALWGTERSLLANMVEGVTNGYQKKLEIQGIGFRAELSGSNLKLLVGFTHPIEFPIPSGISVVVEKNIITVSGIDYQQVGDIAAQIRSVKPPEPYKGKGIRYVGEEVRRKEGKAAGAGASAK